MDIWNILGIEPTEDKNITKKAYLAKLKVTHPEEKPDEFAKLKEAYDLAQQFKFSEVEAKSDFLVDLELLYSNIEKRLKVENWEELFNKYIAKDSVSLDGIVNSNTESIRDELLIFNMEKYYFPHEVWKLIDNEFNIQFNKNELCIKFPENFINFVISNIKYGTIFLYEYLKIEGDKDYELFIEKSSTVSNLIRNGALENQEGLVTVKMLFDEIDNMGIEYLLNDLHKAMFLGYQINLDAKIEKLLEIVDEYKEETLPLKHLAYTYITKEEHQEAQKYYKKVLELDENDIQSKIWLIRSLIDTTDYLEVFKLIKECFKHQDIESHRDILHEYSTVVCEQLLDHFIQVNEEENYTNIRSIKDLGYSYLVLNELKKAREVYLKVAPSDRDVKIYTNLLQSFLYDENYEEFLKMLEEYKETFGEITDSDIAYCCCQYYLIIKDYEGCLNECNKYIGKIENYINIIEIKVEALFEMKAYDDVIEIANLLLKKDHKNFNVTLKASQSYMARQDYYNALDYANTASALKFYSISLQRIRVECYYRLGQAEKAIQLQQHILETGLDDEMINLYACYSYYVLEDYEAALGIINKEESREEKETTFEFIMLHSDVLENSGEVEKAVELLENQMKINYDLEVVSSLARLYNLVNTPDKAVEMLRKVFLGEKELTTKNLEALTYEDFKQNIDCTLDEFQSGICRFGYILFRNYDDYYKEAITIFEKCQGTQTYIRYGFALGYCYNEINEKEKALKAYKLYIENSKHTDLSVAYANLMNIYADLNKSDDELIELYDEAIRDCPDYQQFFNKYVQLLNKNGLYEKCIEVAKKVLNNQNINYFYDAHNEMWSAFIKLNRSEEFKQYNERFLERAKNEEIINKNYHLYHIAVTYIRDKDYFKALEILNFTEKYLYEKYGEEYDFTKSGDDYVLSNLAKCHRLLGNEELAKKYFEMNLVALKDSTKCCLNYHTAHAYAYYGDFEKALEYAFEAEKTEVEMNTCSSAPICRHAYEILGEIYSEMGEDKLAIESYEKFLEFEFQLDILNEVERLKSKCK